ncbi:pilus assembly protein PilP [Neisseria sp. Ec49-e6-T10]|uniref:pilus assembly protein PilP n=1 Tax=Neisseria sp. Ec49-e6-T10 TaxID=3140744 RepID=UPI003EB85E51
MNNLLLKSVNFRSVAILCFSVVLVGCGAEHDDLRSWVATTRSEATAPAQELAVVVPYTPYNHKVSTKLNAFDVRRLTLARQTNTASAPDLDRPKEALESFDLSEVAMVGAMEKQGVIQALVKVSGRVYAVGIGNYMGQDFGKVTAITSDGLTLEEKVEDTDGNWITRETQVSLTEAN